MSNKVEQSTIMTVESRIDKDEVLYQFLDEYAGLYCFLERKLYNDIYYAEDMGEDFQKERKRFYIAEYKIPARMFNSLWVDAKGMYDSTKELMDKNLKDLKRQLKNIEDDIKTITKKLKNKNLKSHEIKSFKQSLYFKYNKKETLNNKIKNFGQKQVVFGSRDLYKEQWTNSKYKDNHDKWLSEWRLKRNGHFFCVGSSDENTGNLNCQYVVTDKGQFLQVALPNCMIDKYKMDYVYPKVNFLSDVEDKYYKYYFYFQKALWEERAMSYRFIKKNNGYWYVHASFTLSEEADVSYNGYVGIDTNSDMFATSDIDANGNYISKFKNYEFDSRGKTSEQNVQIISDVVNDIVAGAKSSNRDICFEDLDLEKKKSGDYKETNRKISAIAYAIFKRLLISRCVKEGVRFHIVNSAYTSVIGKYKYAKLYGISVHNAAAIVIARRGMYKFVKDKNGKDKKKYCCKETVPTMIDYVLRWVEADEWSNIHSHNHSWPQWKHVSQNLGECLKKVNTLINSIDGGDAINMNTLLSRGNPGLLSFLSRLEYFSIEC